MSRFRIKSFRCFPPNLVQSYLLKHSTCLIKKLIGEGDAGHPIKQACAGGASAEDADSVLLVWRGWRSSELDQRLLEANPRGAMGDLLVRPTLWFTQSEGVEVIQSGEKKIFRGLGFP